MSFVGLLLLMSNKSKFEINTSDSIKCISSSEDGMKIAFGDNSGNIALATNEGSIIWEKNIDEGTYGIAIMKDGIIHQCADPIEILTKPETAFVGSFVSQNNLINISFENGLYTTPFGSIIVQQHLIKQSPRLLMVDEMSINVRRSNNSNGIIKGREFNNTSWVFRVQYEDQILRVSAPLDTELNIGDYSEINLIPGKYGFLFPGSISCILK